MIYMMKNDIYIAYMYPFYTKYLFHILNYGGPEVQNTKQTKQNKNYVSLSFLHYFDTFLPKT